VHGATALLPISGPASASNGCDLIHTLLCVVVTTLAGESTHPSQNKTTMI
jgi:hypothetical protein